MPDAAANKPNQVDDPTTWVARYGDSLLRFAMQRAPCQEVAEDLVQETFLSAYRHRQQFDGRSQFGTWLVAILRRKIVDHYRASPRVAAAAHGQSSDTTSTTFDRRGNWVEPPAKWHAAPDVLAENVEFWEVFQNCFTRLPRHLAQAFEARVLRDASIGDAAEIAGITRKNLAVRLHRARILLRECLEHHWFRCDERILP